jgi:hypothetical protein
VFGLARLAGGVSSSDGDSTRRCLEEEERDGGVTGMGDTGLVTAPLGEMGELMSTNSFLNSLLNRPCNNLVGSKVGALSLHPPLTRSYFVTNA